MVTSGKRNLPTERGRYLLGHCLNKYKNIFGGSKHGASGKGVEIKKCQQDQVPVFMGPMERRSLIASAVNYSMSVGALA
jgi:hypothetical protein